MSKRCLICDRELTKPGQFYDIGIGPTCYQKANPSAKLMSSLLSKSYKAKLEEPDKSIKELPLFKEAL